MMQRFVLSATATSNHDDALRWWRMLETPDPTCNEAAARSMLIIATQNDAISLLDTLTSDEAALAIESATLARSAPILVCINKLQL